MKRVVMFSGGIGSWAAAKKVAEEFGTTDLYLVFSDVKGKSITLSDGTTLSYDKLCIATGTSPIKPRVKGIDYSNVFVLRSHNDQEAIK